MKPPTIKTVRDARYQAGKLAKYPIRLRITYDRKQYYLTLNVGSLTKAEFKRKEKQGDFMENELRAKNILEKMRVFDWDTFKKKWANAEGDGSLNSYFNAYIGQLIEEDKSKTERGYICARNSLAKFSPGLLLNDITIELHRKYQNWLLKKGNSITTVSMYARCLRTIMNQAISAGDLPVEYYPFGEGKYIIPAPKAKKIFLKIDEIEDLRRYKPRNEEQAFAKDMFLFSYLNFGKNMKDVCRLRQSDIKKGVIHWDVRSKTAESSADQPRTDVDITEEIQDILSRRRINSLDPQAFVFGILNPGMTDKQVTNSMIDFFKRLNAGLKEIELELDLSIHLTSGVARASMANRLKTLGEDKLVISQVMGHKRFSTTENYLASFEQERVKQAQRKL
jgi:integrase